MATSVAKNTGKYAAGVKARAANSMAKFGLRAAKLSAIIRADLRTLHSLFLRTQSAWQRKGKLALRAKAIATQVAKLWQKLWQGLKAGRVSGKSLGKADGTLHDHRILYAASGLHKWLMKLCHMQSK